MNIKSKRDSNFELMRIISMIFIVIFHVMLHGWFLYNAEGGYRYLFMLLYSLTIVHVNSFILLTGYFQCEKEIRVSKIIALNNETWFYKVLFLIIVIFSGIELASPITTVDKIRTLLPIDFGSGYSSST